MRADHQPADKIAVAGSGLEVLDADFAAAESETVTLMAGVLRASSPTDLIISVSAECSIITDVTTIGNNDQQAAAQLKVWVERVKNNTTRGHSEGLIGKRTLVVQPVKLASDAQI